jgi:hypothetical protein
VHALTPSAGHGDPSAINRLHKASGEGTCLGAVSPIDKQAPDSLGGCVGSSDGEMPTPQSMGAQASAPPDLTNSLELALKLLSSEPNEGPHSELGVLPTP